MVACTVALLILMAARDPLPAHAQTTLSENLKLLASDFASGDRYGDAVDVDGTVAIVGARQNNSSNGAAYILRYDGGAWTETSILTPNSPVNDELFGRSVAIDGRRAIIGAEGGAYIFEYDGSQWIEVVRLNGAGTSFGQTVDVEADRAVIGFSSETVTVYQFDGTIWSQETTLTASDESSNDQFGTDVTLQGNAIVVGAPFEDDGGSQAGAAYVFRLSGTTWTEEAKLVASDAQASDLFGEAVSLSGNLALIGAPEEDGGVGDPASNAGAGYIFRYDGSLWSQETILRLSTAQPNDRFASAVAIDGTGAVVGTPGRFGDGGSDAGAAFIYQFNGSSWLQEARLLSSDLESSDRFGNAVAIDRNTVFVGAPEEDGGASNPAFSAGTVYVFGPPVAAAPPASAQPGGAITVSVDLGSAALPFPDVLGAGFKLQYDPTRLQAVSAVAGPFIDDGDLVNDSFIDNGAGVVSIGVFRKGSNGSVSGFGTVAEVTFQVPSGAPINVDAAITVSDVLTVDGTGRIVASYPVAGQVSLVDGTTLTVWPGDTDNSGIVDPATAAVNAADVLPIANCFNLTGPPRSGPFSIQWEPTTVDPWTFPPVDPAEDCAATTTFTNPAYADATGDGIINQNDLSAVGLNFGLARSASGPSGTLLLAVAPEMVVGNGGPFPTVFLPETEEGRTYRFAVHLNDPIAGFRGLTARLRLPADLFRISDVAPGSWLDDGDLLQLDDYDVAEGRLELAASRKRGRPSVHGTGVAVEISATALRTTSTTAAIMLESAVANVRGEGPVGLTTTQASLEVVGGNEPTDAPKFALSPVNPHPLRGSTQVEYELGEAGSIQLTVFDILGRRVATVRDGWHDAGVHTAPLDARTLAPGLYFVRLTSGTSSMSQRVTVVR